MIAAPVQGKVDGVPKGARHVRVPIAMVRLAVAAPGVCWASPIQAASEEEGLSE
jgi:hypothetical protein